MLTYVIVAIGVAVITALIMYLDSRLFDRPKQRSVYIKTILMTVTIVLVTLGILSWLSPSKNPTDVIQMGSKSAPKITGNMVAVPEIGEEMLAGEAKF